MLSACIYPVLLHWLLAPQPARLRYLGMVLGLALAGAVAVSRVVLGAHSTGEVVIAWCMGVVVSVLVVRTLSQPGRPPLWVRLAPLMLLASLHTTTATYLPSHSWEVRLALALSGQDNPYTRHWLLSKK